MSSVAMEKFERGMRNAGADNDLRECSAIVVEWSVGGPGLQSYLTLLHLLFGVAVGDGVATDEYRSLDDGKRVLEN